MLDLFLEVQCMVPNLFLEGLIFDISLKVVVSAGLGDHSIFPVRDLDPRPRSENSRLTRPFETRGSRHKKRFF
jgi:hypothetical protein